MSLITEMLQESCRNNIDQEDPIGFILAKRV